MGKAREDGSRQQGEAERVFLGWDGPLLPRAARWLVERHGVDFSGLLVALPGRRAGRRLLELLVDEAARARPGEILVPPEIVTAGRLADRLLLPGEHPLAGRLARTLLWARVASARAAHPPGLQALFPRPPAAGDLAGWVELSQPLRTLHAELAASGLSFADVAARAGVEQQARWRLLASLQDDWRRELSACGLADPHEARLEALAAGRVDGDVRAVVLVGVTEDAGLLRRTLASHPAPVAALVFAPQDEAGGFDALGMLRPAAWVDRQVPVARERWHVVDRPPDQAKAAAALLHELRAAGREPWEVTFGLLDLDVVPFLQRQLAMEGLSLHEAAGVPVRRTAPLRLLEALGEYLGGRRFAALATLLRHPDLEDALTGEVTLRLPLPALLDEVHGDRLPESLPERAPDPPHKRADETHDEKKARHAALRLVDACKVARRLAQRLGTLADGASRPLAAWADPIAAALGWVYDRQPLDPDAEHDQLPLAALQALGEALGELRELPARLSEALPADGRTALAVLHAALTGAASPARVHDERSVEGLGWLELPLDDAPVLLLTGFAEGHLPEPLRPLPLLPDALRAALGLPGAEQRLARDLHGLTALLHAREQVHLISGRRSLLNDPLHPSRLVFHCPDDEVVPRVRRLLAVQRDSRTTGSEAAPPREHVPPLHPVTPVLERLSATQFATWLQSPYNFYLQRLLRLQTVDDDARELDPLSFGGLAHAVLEAFGRDEDSQRLTDAGKLAAALSAHLDDVVALRFPARLLPAVLLQIERLRLRLRDFAREQVAWAAQGWSIRHVEWMPAGGVELDVDGLPLRLTGRIDRIDVNAATGQWAILDYKSGDRAAEPASAHRRNGEWINLQLPLYRLLAAPLGPSDDILFGYVNLPKRGEEAGFELVPWSADELAAADETARRVVREIRAALAHRGERPFALGDFPAFDEVLADIAGMGLAGAVAEDEADAEAPAAEGAL